MKFDLFSGFLVEDNNHLKNIEEIMEGLDEFYFKLPSLIEVHILQVPLDTMTDAWHKLNGLPLKKRQQQKAKFTEIEKPAQNLLSKYGKFNAAPMINRKKLIERKP